MMYNNALRVQMTYYGYSFPRHHWKGAYAELTFIMYFADHDTDIGGLAVM